MMRASRAGNPGGIDARASCPSYPDPSPDAVDDHEPLATEMRCAYCGERLRPVTCSGCGKFMTAAEMHTAYFEGIWRCEECI